MHTRYHYGSATTDFEAKFKSEMERIKVAPAAGGYLRRYGVLPSQVIATGPRGHVLKGDVLQYIAKMNLQPRSLLTEEQPIEPKPQPEAVAKPALQQAKPQAAPPKKQAIKVDQTASPEYNPNNPF